MFNGAFDYLQGCIKFHFQSKTQEKGKGRKKGRGRRRKKGRKRKRRRKREKKIGKKREGKGRGKKDWSSLPLHNYITLSKIREFFTNNFPQ